jgi:hypothetical protein
MVLDVVNMDRGPNRGRGLELPKKHALGHIGGLNLIQQYLFICDTLVLVLNPKVFL